VPKTSHNKAMNQASSTMGSESGEHRVEVTYKSGFKILLCVCVCVSLCFEIIEHVVLIVHFHLRSCPGYRRDHRDDHTAVATR